MAYTYILFSKSLNKYYIGHTEGDVAQRLQKHLTEHNGFTSRAKDWVIAYTKWFESKQEAFLLERKIKSWKSRVAIQKLIEEG